MTDTDRAPRKISFVEKLSFGLGDFGINGMFTFVSSYLLYFYTDSVKISLEAAGIILFLGRAVDAAACIAAGHILDKTDTRLGKCRPFIAVGTVPVIMLMCILFTMPDVSDTAKLIYGCVIYVLFSVIYAFVNVPYSTMLSVITNKNEERLSFNIFKNIGGNGGALFVTLSALILVGRFGGAEGGYFRTALLYACFFLAGMLLCVCNTKERVRAARESTGGIKESAKVALKNRNWLIFIVIQFTGMLYMIIHNQGTFYYTKYYLGDERLNTIMLSLTPLLGVLCAFVLPHVAKRIGMKHVMACGHALVGISLLGTLAAGKNTAAVVIFAVITSLGWCVATGMIFVILSQLIDWSEKESGLRPQGFMASWMTFFMKMGVAAAGFVEPWILKWGGYVAGGQADARTIQAIKMNFIYVPVVLAFGMVILCTAYRLPEDTSK